MTRRYIEHHAIFITDDEYPENNRDITLAAFNWTESITQAAEDGLLDPQNTNAIVNWIREQ